MTPRELRIAKIVFWGVSPLVFAGLVRLFFLFFYFIFGMLLLWIFGVKYNPVVFWLAVLASVGFTAAALVILYRMFKIHVLEQP